ncbi:MAG: hypothetical protein IVW51_17660 [Thermaceae bacterium]|nr:hypothetical protein [Thermaceae bacterium]
MKLYHPQFEQIFDRKSGVVFEPEKVGEIWRATADVPEEAVPDFIERGFLLVNPLPPSAEPAPEKPRKEK